MLGLLHVQHRDVSVMSPILNDVSVVDAPLCLSTTQPKKMTMPNMVKLQNLGCDGCNQARRELLTGRYLSLKRHRLDDPQLSSPVLTDHKAVAALRIHWASLSSVHGSPELQQARLFTPTPSIAPQLLPNWACITIKTSIDSPSSGDALQLRVPASPHKQLTIKHAQLHNKP